MHVVLFNESISTETVTDYLVNIYHVTGEGGEWSDISV